MTETCWRRGWSSSSVFQPDMVLSENVAAIERGAHGQIWQDFKTDLRRQGYRVGYGVVDASRFEVPQHRRRSIIIAVKAARAERVNLDLSLPSGCDGEPRKVRDAIGELPTLRAGERDESVPNHQCRNLSDINRRRLLAVEPGEPNFGFPDELALPCHRRLNEKGKPRIRGRLHSHSPGPSGAYHHHALS